MTDRTEGFPCRPVLGNPVGLVGFAGAFRKRNYKYAAQAARQDFTGGLGCALLFSRC